jgi:hypothetical protein
MKILGLISSYLPSGNIFVVLVRIILSPIITALSTPIVLVKTLYKSRILIAGDWLNYPHFNADISMTSHFYSSASENLMKYGLKRKTPYMANGDFSLSHFFYMSFFSAYFYQNAGAVLVLSSMLTWVGCNFIWLLEPALDPVQISLSSLTLLTGSLFFGLTFSRQNYNALGWLFFPLIIYGVLTSNYILLAAAILLSSLGSITVALIGCILTSVYFVLSFDFNLLYAMLPVVLKVLLFHIWPCREGLLKTFTRIVSVVSSSNKKIKYKRVKSIKEILGISYHSVLYLQFMVVSWIITDEISTILIFGFLLYQLNCWVFRFSDYESMYTMMGSICIASLILSFSWPLFVSYLLVINPLPILMGFDKMKNVFEIPKIMKPFNIGEIRSKIEDLIKKIPKNETVTMNFNEVDGDYYAIYDGLNSFREVVGYVATKNERLFYPDSYCVYQDNVPSEDQGITWGRDNNQVIALMKSVSAKYTIYYSGKKNGKQSLEDYGLKDLEHVDTLDWGDFDKLLSYYDYTIPAEKRYWHLLRLKSH